MVVKFMAVAGSIPGLMAVSDLIFYSSQPHHRRPCCVVRLYGTSEFVKFSLGIIGIGARVARVAPMPPSTFVR